MITVLYVDADPDICSIISSFFAKYDLVSLFPAGSGEEALTWLSRYHADVVVSEYYLPDMDAIALLHGLRDHGFATPLILFSETSSDSARNKAWQADVFGFIFRNGLERRPFMNLLRLIAWAAGSTDTEYPFITRNTEA
jgi:DNA-binding NtrC family response regulator